MSTRGAQPQHQPLKEALPQGYPARSQLPWCSDTGSEGLSLKGHGSSCCREASYGPDTWNSKGAGQR